MLTLDDWLVQLEQLHPEEIELGLDRVSSVASQLEIKLPTVVSFAGTNGKGSCIAVCEQLLLKADYKIGTYTSPHFLSYNERIRVNGNLILDDELCDAFVLIEDARGDISLTFFEFTTLAALIIFSQKELDIVLLEVGLGGRLDAVNIVDADIAVITNIALDHQSWLGNDRETIGIEKAGIMRSGSSVVLGDDMPSSVLEYADGIESEIFLAGKDFQWLDESTWNGINKDGDLIALKDLVLPPLSRNSVSCALQVINLLIEAARVEELTSALGYIGLPGRSQWSSYRGKPVLLDVAHNPAAANYLADKLSNLPEVGKIGAIFAVMSDKDIKGVCDPLKPYVGHWQLPTLESNLRACAPEELQSYFSNENVVLSSSVAESMRALINSNECDIILVYGSFYTVAEAMKILSIEHPDLLRWNSD